MRIKTPRHVKIALLGAALLSLTSLVVYAQQITGTPGSPGATTTIGGKQLPPPDPKFGGVIKDDALQSKPWWAPRVVPPKGAPNVLLIITDDAGFGVPEHLRRRHPDADDGPHREGGPALQPHVLHRAVLADARRADHRAQPPLGRLRRDLRAVDRLPRLQQHHRQGQGHDRPHPARQRLLHVVVRQGPQHAGLRGQPGRAVRPVADRHGLRVLLRLRRRRRQPVAAEPVPQHDADLSVRRASRGLEPGHRHGRRRHRLDDADAPDRPEQADLHQVRARRHARAAPPDQGMGGQDQQDEAVRRGLEQGARAHLREPEAARRDPEGRQAAAVAEGRAEGVGPADGGREEALSSARSRSSPPTPPTATTRSGA